MSSLHRALFDVKSKRPLINEATPLGDVPLLWLQYVEPKIERIGFNGCWISRHPMTQRGMPVLSYTDDEGNRVRTTVAKFVMRIFWDFPDGYFIKRTCEWDQCVNPNHLYICPNAWGH